MAEHRGAHPAIVAVDDGEQVLGFGSLSVFRDRPAYATTVENSVYVDAASRGAGVGRALLDELVVLAGQHGFHTVIARVGGDNEASIALHLACGFEMVGVEREVGRKFNRWLDVVGAPTSAVSLLPPVCPSSPRRAGPPGPGRVRPQVRRPGRPPRPGPRPPGRCRSAPRRPGAR